METNKEEISCCSENDGYEDDSYMDICRSCKEWTCVVRCTECDEIIFDSSCCG